MVDLSLANYVVQARAAEMSDEEIRQALMASGWSLEAIDEALGRPPAVAISSTALPVAKQNPAAFTANPRMDATLSTPLTAIDTTPPPRAGMRKPLFIALITLGILAVAGGAAYYFYFIK